MENISSIRLGESLYPLKNGLVMGIMNITPDSFYSSSRARVGDNIVQRVQQMLDDGMDILDIGAVSSRPGAEMVTEKEEWGRLEPILALLLNSFPDVPVSLDTYRSEIANHAVSDYGVKMINDISAGLFDPKMARVIGSLGVPIVLMHMRGDSRTMQENPTYSDVTLDLIQFFSHRLQEFLDAGAHDIIIDPGFGFGKTTAHNYTLLNQLDRFKNLGYPLLVGLSRKSMIYKSLDITPEESLNGTSILNTIARIKGADILRVHDVKAATECLKLSNLLGIRDKTNFQQ